MREIGDRLSATALVFRGYNVTNLGRSAELLAHAPYRPIVEACLGEASEVCAQCIGAEVNLAARVRNGLETGIDSFAEAVALVIAMELAQLRLLKELFGVDYTCARMSFGYSLGEIAALIVGGMFEMRDALRIPLSVAQDCAELARDCTLAVLFSRGAAIDTAAVERACLNINLAGRGAISVSSFLSPNSLVLNGQADTVDRFHDQMSDSIPQKLYLRKNDNRWPPLHTSITWQRSIPNRAALLMQTMPILSDRPNPPVFSLVTGSANYRDLNTRQQLAEWIDHPQRLWDAVYETCAQAIERVIHIGPAPNLVPATFTRLAENVKASLGQRTWAGMGLRAVANAVRRPWLAKLLPQRSALLRAPLIEQVNLEDWLLEQASS